MEVILACHPARSSEWLDWVAKSFDVWRVRKGPIDFLSCQTLLGKYWGKESKPICLSTAQWNVLEYFLANVLSQDALLQWWYSFGECCNGKANSNTHKREFLVLQKWIRSFSLHCVRNALRSSLSSCRLNSTQEPVKDCFRRKIPLLLFHLWFLCQRHSHTNCVCSNVLSFSFKDGELVQRNFFASTYGQQYVRAVVLWRRFPTSRV